MRMDIFTQGRLSCKETNTRKNNQTARNDSREEPLQIIREMQAAASAFLLDGKFYCGRAATLVLQGESLHCDELMQDWVI